MGVLRVVSQSKRHLCVGRWCEERESVVNKILSALRLDQLSFKKKAQQLDLWRTYPFLNDCIDTEESVTGHKVLSSTNRTRCKDINFKGCWL